MMPDSSAGKVCTTMDYERIRQQLAKADAPPRTTAATDNEVLAGETADPPMTSAQRRRAGRRRQKSTAVTNRHAIRQLALLALFELDVTDHEFEDVVQRVIADPFLSAGGAFPGQPVEAELDLPPEALSDHRALERGVRDLVYGVIRYAGPIDEMIVAAAPAYPIDRIGTIDRNVLRLGIYELEYVHTEAIADVVNEAVELGKRFGGANTASFVNGVLRTVSERIEAAGA